MNSKKFPPQSRPNQLVAGESRIGLSFFQQPTLLVAQQLLGLTLVRSIDGQRLAGKIVEVEAYHQDGDQAAHSFRGKTRRNATMFGPAGYLYVYFIYGMHFCMNVVTEEDGVGAAVLIRAIQPIDGISVMKHYRGPSVKLVNLTNGPAKCCQALSIGRDQDGMSLQQDDLFLEPGDPLPAQAVKTSPRIGISKSKSLPWRFYLEGNPFVSKGP